MVRLWRRDLPRWGFLALVAAIYLYMFLPIAVVVLTSLNPGQYLRLPPPGLSLRWYAAALAPEWLEPFRISLVLAATTAVAASLLGLPAALALVRHRFPGREALNALLLSPLSLPAIVSGVAILQFLSLMGLRGLIGFPALLLAHTALTVPYAIRTIAISLHGFDRSLELAAMNLGATPWRTFRYVTLPLIKPGLFAGMVFAFIVSFNNVPVSLFLVRPGMVTLPIRILNYLEYRFDPSLAAVNMLSLLVVLVIVAAAERTAGFTRFVYAR
ncbi:MAG: ABC transporter permease [Armatimonadota bacterium]|nr:ABC transporter permease [Armatimonadota bacterium]